MIHPLVMMTVLPGEGGRMETTRRELLLGKGFALNENIFRSRSTPLEGVEISCLYTTKEEYFMHVLADLNYANGKRAAIKVIIKL
jgi:N-dimethylarginine dimethylaminohydrolase